MNQSRRSVLRATVIAVAGLIGGRVQAILAEEATMAAAARAFLQSLGEDERRRVVFDFADRERFDWHYTPRRRAGLPLGEMSELQRTAAHTLLRAGLSATGYRKVLDTMKLEAVLKEIETFGFNRDPHNYALTVFGDPSEHPWGWRFEGHHLSLNFAVVELGRVSITPAFIGSNPATVSGGEERGLRTMGEEEDLGRSLIAALAPAQQARAIIADRSFGDILTGPGRAEALVVPEGLRVSEMRGETRDLVERLIGVYLSTASDAIATAHRQRIREAGVETIRFAWAGHLEPGRPHYYRLHGPRLLIEFDKTRNNANHIHSVLRDPANDFGRDYLGGHYASAGVAGHDHVPTRL